MMSHNDLYVEQVIYIYVHELTHENGGKLVMKQLLTDMVHISFYKSLFTNHSFLQILLSKTSVKMETLSLKRHRVHIRVSR